MERNIFLNRRLMSAGIAAIMGQTTNIPGGVPIFDGVQRISRATVRRREPVRLNRSARWPYAKSYRDAREKSPSPRPVDGTSYVDKHWRKSAA